MRVKNALLVRWADGYISVSDANSITAYGRHEDFLSAGDAQSTTEATRLALGLLSRMAWPAEDIIVAVEPRLTADAPYTGFVVGDNVTAPDSTGVQRTWRVSAITVTEDEEGNAIYVPKLVIDESGS